MDKRCIQELFESAVGVILSKKWSIRCNSTSLPITCNIDYNNILIIEDIIWTKVVSKNCFRVLLVLYGVRKWSIRSYSTSLPITCNIDYNNTRVSQK